MKRILMKWTIPAIAAVLFLSACSSSRPVPVAERSDIKGTWLLNSITYEGLSSTNNINITLLDEGNADCLQGSTWKFPNNGNGSYDIVGSGGNCLSGTRNIVWSTRQEGDRTVLQFKRVSGDVKPKNVTDGYRFTIVSADKTNLALRSEVAFEGKSIFINYAFTRQ